MKVIAQEFMSIFFSWFEVWCLWAEKRGIFHFLLLLSLEY